MTAPRRSVSVGDFLYFSSNRTGGQGGFDLYRVRLLAGALGDIEHLDDTVNTASDELDPALGLGGFELHFSSNRATVAASDGEPTYDIYRTTSREVFLDAEPLLASFDWGGLWAGIAPCLLALLLLLLLLYLLRGFVELSQSRRLSLIMRCLLASALLHLLLLALFTVWQVHTSLSGLFRRPGGVKVALAAPVRTAGLARQVRGAFSAFIAPPSQTQPDPASSSPPGGRVRAH
jgi:hypothetical protein